MHSLCRLPENQCQCDLAAVLNSRRVAGRRQPVHPEDVISPGRGRFNRLQPASYEIVGTGLLGQFRKISIRYAVVCITTLCPVFQKVPTPVLLHDPFRILRTVLPGNVLSSVRIPLKPKDRSGVNEHTLPRCFAVRPCADLPLGCSKIWLPIPGLSIGRL